jgi:hypothetical protein
MKEQDSKYLMCRFPRLFSSFMKRGEHAHHQFSIGDGWYGIVTNICHEIFKLQYYAELEYSFINVDCSQIKGKFGGLRFYYSIDIECESRSSKRFIKINEWVGTKMCRRGFAKQWWAIDRFRRKYIYETWYEKVRTVVKEGEWLSYKTCEVCGEPGKRCIPSGDWMSTLCKKHEEEEKSKREKGEW